MPSQGFDEAPLAEFFAPVVERFGDAIRIKREGVSGKKTVLPNATVPLSEETQHRAGGIQPHDAIVIAKQQGSEMAAIRIAQPAG